MDYTLLSLDLSAGDPAGNVTIHSGASSQCAVPWYCAAKQGSVLWDSCQPTRLTIPSGVTSVRFSCGVALSKNNVGDRQVYLRKNGANGLLGYPLGYISDIRPAALTSVSGQSWTDVSAVMDVVEGDYFELMIFQTSGVDIQLRALGSTWFQCEVV